MPEDEWVGDASVHVAVEDVQIGLAEAGVGDPNLYVAVDGSGLLQLDGCDGAGHRGRHGVDLPSAAVAYPLRRPEITSVVVGLRTAAQVESTVARYRTRVPDALRGELVANGLVPA